MLQECGQTEPDTVRKLTRISVESETVWVFRGARVCVAWCRQCGAEVDVITLTPDSFAESATTAQVEQWLGTGKLHLWQTPEGTVHICVTSLLQSSV